VLISSFRLHPLADLTRLWEALHAGKVTLMALGFSRTAAIEISGRIAADNLSEEGCIEFLSTDNWLDSPLSELVKREISEFLKARTSSVQ
jgi:hypothetical protein